MPDPGTSHTSPTLLLVGGARGASLGVDMVVRALAQARARGLRTHVTSRADALAAAPEAVEAADAVSVVDHGAPGETAAWAVRETAQGARFDVVLALQEMAQVAAAETAEALGLFGNPAAAVRRIRTKDACRRALAEAGFAQPKVRLCEDAAAAREFLARSRGPWIVKPRDAMGSLGVSLVTGPAKLPAAMELLPDNRPFLVEEFVDGPEFSVEGMFLGGAPKVLAITAKEKVPPPYFVEVGHVLPAGLPERVRAEVERQVRGALRALDLRAGAFHVECWLTADGVVIGEVHGRCGGDWIHRMLEYVVPGLDLFGVLCDDLLRRGRGAGAPATLEPVRAAAVRYLVPPPGRVVSIDGWERVRAQPDVLHAELTVAEGDVIRPVQRSGDRAGFVLVGAPNASRARERARELADAVRFTTLPEPP
ncbi:ATP-grasp domain-containing protein [Streptomyces sp. NPDC050704]|uniref:ATP-grasp domain-containing protein n=1 Tax=Streptomyces sp. NPDC050704 TaxID=3157219 RepID=UPI00342A9C9D